MACAERACAAPVGWAMAGDLALLLLLALALGTGLVLLVAAVRPPHFKIERALRIQAPPQQVFALLQNLRRWEDWSTWGPFAATVTRRFSRTSTGLGAGCYWQDKAHAGEGSMEIMHLAAPSQLAIAVTATLPVDLHQLAEFMLSPDEAGATKLSWLLRGEAPYQMRVKSVLRSHDRRLGRRMQADLQRLQALAERTPPQLSPDDAMPAPG